MSELDKEKLGEFVEKRIQRGYRAEKTANEKKYWQGYVDALLTLKFYIEQGDFDAKKGTKKRA